jgi:uncharacterized membrane protein YeaQ/YmgE (transglycosylase-associated protein family)
MLALLWTILIGFLIGLVARFVMPGRDAGGFILTTVVGVLGAVVATYGGQALNLYQPGQPAGFLGSVLGAIALLVVLRFVRSR